MKFGFSPLDARILDLEAAISLAAELGMNLELPYDFFEAVPGLPPPTAIREMGRAYGVGFTVHLPFVDLNLASLFPKAWNAALERTRDGLAFAEALGAKVAVLHSGQVPLRHPMITSAAWQKLEEALMALKPLPVPVAVENLALDGRDLLEGPEDLAHLLERHRDYGFCLDFSHAFVEGGLAAVEAYLERLGDRLIHLHINDTPGDRDRHLPVGEGQIPYRALRPAKLPPTATFEVQGDAEALKASLEAIRQSWDI